jgi:hypothetical protein
VTEGDGTVKSKEVQHAEKIYATLRECREQSGVKKNKGKERHRMTALILYSSLCHTALNMMRKLLYCIGV